MAEGDNRRSDEPEERWEDQSRHPFWLDAERGPGSGRAFERLADLTDQAAAAAKRASRGRPTRPTSAAKPNAAANDGAAGSRKSALTVSPSVEG